jgi:hypothetical protein
MTMARTRSSNSPIGSAVEPGQVGGGIRQRGAVAAQSGDVVLEFHAC